MSEPAAAADGYDRWTLRDPSSISYGYYSGSATSDSSNSTQQPASSSAACDGNGTPTTRNKNDGDDDDVDIHKKGFYITTAINYTNGPAHMGHAYEAASADAIARFARLNHKSTGGVGGGGGVDCYFVTGADEHGEKISKTAEKEGKKPIEICDKVRSKLLLLLWHVCVLHHNIPLLLCMPTNK